MVCCSFASSELIIGGMRENLSISSASRSSSPKNSPDTRLPAVSTARPERCGNSTGSLRDFGYDTELLGHDEIDDKNLVGLRGVVKVSHVVVNGTSLLNLDAFAPASQWEQLSSASPASLAVWEGAK